MIERPIESPGGDAEGPSLVPSQQQSSADGAPLPSVAPSRSYVFALGRIEPRFPSLGVEKEFAQATGRAQTSGLTDREAVHALLGERANRYLARQLCWVLTVEGLETYILVPRDPLDLDLLIEAVRPAPSPMDLDVVIGVRGPIASPDMCNGLLLPVVVVDQIYSFNRDALIVAIPRPDKVTAERFRLTAEEILDRIMQLADNAGATDEHRALNYLAVRYDRIYAETALMHARNFSLTAVEVRHSPLSGARKIADVIFKYTHRETDVDERLFVRVDLTEEFPFLVSRLQPYYER